MARSSTRKSKSRVRDKTDIAILQEFHSWGFCSSKTVSILLGFGYSMVVTRIRKLTAAGLLKPLGFLRVNTIERGYAAYLRPIFFRSKSLSGLVQRGRNLDLNGPSFMRFSHGGYAPDHALQVLLAAEWIAFNLRIAGKSLRIEPEFLLRYRRGWYGGGQPPKHLNPVLAMVPDFLVETNAGAFHVEVELTPKSKPAYISAFLKLQPRNRPVLFVTMNPQMTATVLRQTSGIGARITVLEIGDDVALGAFLAGL